METPTTDATATPALHPEHGKHRVLSGFAALIVVCTLLFGLWYLYGNRVAPGLGGAEETETEALLPAPPPVPDSLPVLSEEPLPDTSALPTQTP